MSDGGFFDFRTLVSNTIIKSVYVIGALIITVSSLLLIAYPVLIPLIDPAVTTTAQSDISKVLAGATLLILGNLLWRLLCEGWIILFSLHEMISAIEKRLVKEDATAAQLEFIGKQLHATEQNSEQRHAELVAALRSTQPQSVTPINR
ncbi:MAG: DUF4282 domain-containing protein [Acidobacteria bacterium]|nr:DUF4282 domain-containing protein [Acidobacteriota bacterium]